MISIYVITDNHTLVNQILNEAHLEKDVYLINQKLLNTNKETPSSLKVCLLNDEITVEPDWNLQIPPVLFPFPIQYTKQNLLALLYLFIGDEKKALENAAHNELLQQTVLAFVALKHQLPIASDFQENTYFFQCHNSALLAHYGLLQGQSHTQVKLLYNKAITLDKNQNRSVFTKYHYSSFLLDAGSLKEAIVLIKQALTLGLSPRITLLFKYQYADALLGNEPNKHLPELKPLISSLLSLSRDLFDDYQEAMVLQLAAEVAELENNYMEALGCLQKAFNYFKTKDLKPLEANIHYRKGELLLAWAHKGNAPMFAKSAACFREALQYFNKDNSPETFANIHHKLGMIYAEMPTAPEKRAMVAALSVTSFNEALNYFSKTSFPYQYAAIQQDMGNAYLKYPDSLLNDNYKKAIQYYQEALSIRTRDHYPLERSLTLLNYLEALWLLPQENQLSTGLIDEMESMAIEVKEISGDKGLIDEAERHLKELNKLKTSLENA